MDNEQDSQEEIIEDEESESSTDDGAEQHVPLQRLNKEIKKRKELEERLSGLEERLTEKETPKQTPEETEVDPTVELYEKVAVLRDLDQEEFTDLTAKAKDLGTTPEKLAKTTMWQGHLKGIREKKAQDAKVPEPSTRSTKVAGKTFHEMNAKDRAANWTQLINKG